MSISTAEDVFYLYERNSSWYYNCKKQLIFPICKSIYSINGNNNYECFCESNQIVKPITIGNQNVSCSLERKCYITPGKECPICFDKILRKSEAYLTGCGHAFHKKCIFK